jgi:hypothetical protein
MGHYLDEYVKEQDLDKRRDSVREASDMARLRLISLGGYTAENSGTD